MALIDDLKTTNAVLQKNHDKEVQFLQEEKKCLQRKFNDMKHSYHEFIAKYQNDVSELNLEIEKHKQEISQEKETNLQTVKENQKLINDLTAEKEELQQKMTEEITILKNRETYIVNELNLEIEKYKHEISKEKEANLQTVKENLKLINNLTAEKEELQQKMTEEITILKKREKYILNELDQVHFLHDELEIKYENDVIELQQQAETYKEIIKQRETNISEREGKEKFIQEELEKFKCLYLEQNYRYETDITALQQKAEKYQQEISNMKEELKKSKEDQLPDTEDKNNATVLKEEESQNPVDQVRALTRQPCLAAWRYFTSTELFVWSKAASSLLERVGAPPSPHITHGPPLQQQEKSKQPWIRVTQGTLLPSSSYTVTRRPLVETQSNKHQTWLA
uniref:Uncharacterized protein n=1 Tax=Poecilia latipinna TaxID=48699 RepID=A0A3B3TIH5_9TELE